MRGAAPHSAPRHASHAAAFRRLGAALPYRTDSLASCEAADCLVAHPSSWVPLAACDRAFAKTGDT